MSAGAENLPGIIRSLRRFAGCSAPFRCPGCIVAGCCEIVQVRWTSKSEEFAATYAAGSHDPKKGSS